MKPVFVKLYRQKGYEEVHPSILIDDAHIHPDFQPEDITDSIQYLLDIQEAAALVYKLSTGTGGDIQGAKEALGKALYPETTGMWKDAIKALVGLIKEPKVVKPILPDLDSYSLLLYKALKDGSKNTNQLALLIDKNKQFVRTKLEKMRNLGLLDRELQGINCPAIWSITTKELIHKLAKKKTVKAYK